jgi:hypothetical protein
MVAEELAVLANGVIPADEIDAGAAAVNAGVRLAERVDAGAHAALYLQGLEMARSIAETVYSREIQELSSAEVGDILGQLRDRLPGFFAQLRMDVSALYLSDPGVWRRIGFPGPSTQSGGYPDFDQPQTRARVEGS